MRYEEHDHAVCRRKMIGDMAKFSALKMVPDRVLLANLTVWQYQYPGIDPGADELFFPDSLFLRHDDLPLPDPDTGFDPVQP